MTGRKQRIWKEERDLCLEDCRVEVAKERNSPEMEAMIFPETSLTRVQIETLPIITLNNNYNIT